MANLFKPKMPEPQKASPMPDPELAGLSARRAAETAALTRAGRASTILTTRPQRERPATYDSYSAKSLGA